MAEEDDPRDGAEPRNVEAVDAEALEEDDKNPTLKPPLKKANRS